MRRAGDVEHETVAPLDPGPWAIAQGPAAQGVEKTLVGGRICGRASQFGAEDTGIGKGHALVEALPLGQGVQAVQPVRVVGFQREREGAVNRTRPQNPIACETGEPHGDDALPDPIEHSRPLLFLFCS